MVKEMAALHSTGTWDLATLLARKSLVGCRWVYTIKICPDGQVDVLRLIWLPKGILIYMALTTMTHFLLLPR